MNHYWGVQHNPLARDTGEDYTSREVGKKDLRQPMLLGAVLVSYQVSPGTTGKMKSMH